MVNHACAGVLQNEGQLRSYVEDYIVQPLAANATPAPPQASASTAAAPAMADGDPTTPGMPLACTN